MTMLDVLRKRAKEKALQETKRKLAEALRIQKEKAAELSAFPSYYTTASTSALPQYTKPQYTPSGEVNWGPGTNITTTNGTFTIPPGYSPITSGGQMYIQPNFFDLPPMQMQAYPGSVWAVAQQQKASYQGFLRDRAFFRPRPQDVPGDEMEAAYPDDFTTEFIP